jgi:hypothetical protein
MIYSTVYRNTAANIMEFIKIKFQLQVNYPQTIIRQYPPPT